MTGNPESADRANPWAALEAAGAFLPPEAWSVRVVCTGRGQHKALTLARYDHDATDGLRPLDEQHLQGGRHLRGYPWSKRETLPYWEPLPLGDPSIPDGPWGAEPGWGWGRFGRTSHAYVFLCRRCAGPHGTARTGRPREIRVDSCRFVDVYVREAVQAGLSQLDVSDFAEWC